MGRAFALNSNKNFGRTQGVSYAVGWLIKGLPYQQPGGSEVVASRGSVFMAVDTVDLEIRPVSHVLEDRVRAHALICMLAYYLEWHLRRDLAPLLFAEEDPEARHRTRRTIVAPTHATPVAQAKRSKKLTTDGYPVQDFRGVLKNLATLTQQIVQPGIPKLPTFRRFTPATAYQKRIFELLQLGAP